MAKDLINHIKENLKKGYTRETLKYALIKQGYPRTTIERTLEKAEKELLKEEGQKKKEKTKKKPKIVYEVYDQNDNIVEVYKSEKTLINSCFNYLKKLFRRQ